MKILLGKLIVFNINIRDCCGRLADLSDALIRDTQDPLVLQPAYLDIATAKKKVIQIFDFFSGKTVKLCCFRPPMIPPTLASSSSVARPRV